MTFKPVAPVELYYDYKIDGDILMRVNSFRDL